MLGIANVCRAAHNHTGKHPRGTRFCNAFTGGPSHRQILRHLFLQRLRQFFNRAFGNSAFDDAPQNALLCFSPGDPGEQHIHVVDPKFLRKPAANDGKKTGSRTAGNAKANLLRRQKFPLLPRLLYLTARSNDAFADCGANDAFADCLGSKRGQLGEFRHQATRDIPAREHRRKRLKRSLCNRRWMLQRFNNRIGKPNGIGDGLVVPALFGRKKRIQKGALGIGIPADAFKPLADGTHRRNVCKPGQPVRDF